MLNQYIPNLYLRAFIIFMIFFLAIRIILFIEEKITTKITRKTKTNIDDILIKKFSKPFIIISFLISLRITTIEFSIEQNIIAVINNLIYSGMVIIIAYLIYIISDIIIITCLRKVASKTKSDVDDAIISLFHSVLNISFIVISLLYILNLWGIEITPLLAGMGIAGLALALALQPVLGNIFSGASIILDQSIKVGDLLNLDAKTKGKIEQIGLRSTRIRTFDNELIIIPNTKLAESTIQNVALPEPKTRVVVPFSVAYGTNIDKVKQIVIKEIKTIKNLVKEDGIRVRFLEMADSSLNFSAYFYVESFENRADAKDETNTKIYNALNKAGIEIPFPKIDVNLKK